MSTSERSFKIQRAFAQHIRTIMNQKSTRRFRLLHQNRKSFPLSSGTSYETSSCIWDHRIIGAWNFCSVASDDGSASYFIGCWLSETKKTSSCAAFCQGGKNPCFGACAWRRFCHTPCFGWKFSRDQTDIEAYVDGRTLINVIPKSCQTSWYCLHIDKSPLKESCGKSGLKSVGRVPGRSNIVCMLRTTFQFWKSLIGRLVNGNFTAENHRKCMSEESKSKCKSEGRKYKKNPGSRKMHSCRSRNVAILSWDQIGR